MTKIRISYVGVTLLICVGAGLSHGLLASEGWINLFSFWTGVATLIALIVAIGEILNSGAMQALIKEAIVSHVNQQSRVVSSVAIAEAISLLDDANTKLQGQDYQSALRVAQLARRFLIRADSRIFVNFDQINGLSGLFNKAEEKIQMASHSTLAAPLTPKQRSNISSIINDIKSRLELVERSGVIQ